MVGSVVTGLGVKYLNVFITFYLFCVYMHSLLPPLQLHTVLLETGFSLGPGFSQYVKLAGQQAQG